MWPFNRGKSSKDKGEGVDNIQGVGDSKFFEDVKSGEEAYYGGHQTAVAVSEMDRARDMHEVLRKGDVRANIMDTEAIDCLMAKYGKELTVAEEQMRERREADAAFTRYDYKNDRRYHQWQLDNASVLERLQVHWIDMAIDRPFSVLVFYLRIGVVSGFLYGAGRSTYLYRTMDKMYAKLNGVTIGQIAFHELSYSIAKGGIVATAGTLGMIMGNVFALLASVAMSGDVVVPEREWWHVTCSGVVSSFLVGAAFAGVNFQILTRRAMLASIGAFTAVGAAAGWYYGHRVYRPFAAKREHKLYESYWRPWNDRHMKAEGPGNVRGRYL